MALNQVLSIFLLISFAGMKFTDGGPLTTVAVDPVNFTDEIKTLRNLLDTVASRLMSLQMAVQQIPKSDDLQLCRVHRIADAIRARNFELAEEKLIEIKGDDVITEIVHEAYANSSTNMETIMDFAKRQKNEKTKFLVLIALRSEMRSAALDPLSLIGFVKEVQRLVRASDLNIKANAQALIDDVVEEIRAVAIETFKDAMVSDKFSNNVEVETLVNALFDFRLDVSNEVLDEVIKKVSATLDTKKIIRNIASLHHSQQVIPALIAVFNRGNLTNDISVELASHIRSLQEREDYKSVSTFLKNDVDKMVQRLPPFIGNLFFAKRVCLWNRGRNMYLYAADSSYNYDYERRSIFLSTKNSTPEAVWNVEAEGVNEVYFRNVFYNNEYFFPAAAKYDNEWRHVFTWIPERGRKSQYKLSVEFDGEYCYIRSLYFDEYLCAPSLEGKYKNSAFTSISNGNLESDSQCQWQLRNCGRI